MKLLLLDNYDSFTFNLVHLIEKVSDYEVIVKRNDEINLSEFEHYDKIVLSPGPGLPEESGIMLPFIKHYATTKSILGVCLGHQALAVAFGVSLQNLDTVFHGIASETKVIKKDILFDKLPSVFQAGRYHSWIVNASEIKKEFNITAIDAAGNCMAMRHKQYDLCGVQFHPESILTEHGEQLLSNWLKN